MEIRFLENTNIRSTPTDLSVPPLGVIFGGVDLKVEDKEFYGEPINGNNIYFRDLRGWYYWSGKAIILYRSLPEPQEVETDKIRVENKNNGSAENKYTDVEIIDIQEQSEIIAETLPVSNSDEDTNPSESSESFSKTERIPKPADPIAQSSFNYNLDLISWQLQDLNIPALFWEDQKIMGEEIVIAVLDTGVNLNTEDLQGAIAHFRNFSSEQRSDVTDKDGHGTFSASVIAGRGKKEWLGVAPRANLLIGKITDTAGKITSYQGLKAGIEWAIQANTNLIFINIQEPATTFSQQERLELEQIIKTAANKGIVFVAPAGDSKFIKPENRYPAAFTHCFSVGTYNQNRRRATVSLRSYTLDVLAPEGNTITGYEKQVTGFSAAYATGVLALVMQLQLKNKQPFSASEMMDLVRRTASIGKQNIDYGFGLIRPGEILRKIEF